MSIREYTGRKRREKDIEMEMDTTQQTHNLEAFPASHVSLVTSLESRPTLIRPSCITPVKRSCVPGNCCCILSELAEHPDFHSFLPASKTEHHLPFSFSTFLHLLSLTILPTAVNRFVQGILTVAFIPPSLVISC